MGNLYKTDCAFRAPHRACIEIKENKNEKTGKTHKKHWKSTNKQRNSIKTQENQDIGNRLVEHWQNRRVCVSFKRELEAAVKWCMFFDEQWDSVHVFTAVYPFLRLPLAGKQTNTLFYLAGFTTADRRKRKNAVAEKLFWAYLQRRFSVMIGILLFVIWSDRLIR